MPNTKPHAIVLLLICLLLVYGAHVIHRYEAYTYTHFDPGWMVSTVISVVEDRDLDLRNQLKNDPAQAADQTSLGMNGEWFPLHEFVMPLLTVPFYLLFGIKGCLIFNVIVSIVFMIAVFQLCCRHVPEASAFTATVLTAFPTLLVDYTYSYSLDVFSALLLVLAYWCAVSRKFLLTGLVWGLAIYSRLPNAVTLAGLLPFLILDAGSQDRLIGVGFHPSYRLGRWRPLILSLIGAAPVAMCFFFMNWRMYGSPLLTSYDRWQRFIDGKAVISSQRAAFTCSFLDRLPAVLADPKSGLLIGAPLLLVAIAFGTRPFWHKARQEMVLAGLLSIALLVLYTVYCNSFPGPFGNRYLMPVVALAAIPLAMTIENFLGSGQGRL